MKNLQFISRQHKFCIFFSGLFKNTTWVSRHQKGTTIQDFTKQETMGWQWYQLDHKQIIYTLLQTDNHASTSPLIFTGRTPFLPPYQQRQNTESK